MTGDELLSGKRTDKHLPRVIGALQQRGMRVAWSRLVGDDRQRLVRELQLTQQDDIPVLCFGGIGATPDDHTRQAAAEAFGVALVRHPAAMDMIERQFGAAAYPDRARMADLPEDCLLIPNAVNNIPGFTLYDHHFLPGFPLLAWPMLDWVLDSYYPANAQRCVERSVRVQGVRESDLLRLMEALSRRHPDAKLFSLPHMAAVNSIELGFRGAQGAVETALADLKAALTNRALDFEVLVNDAAHQPLACTHPASGAACSVSG